MSEFGFSTYCSAIFSITVGVAIFTKQDKMQDQFLRQKAKIGER